MKPFNFFAPVLVLCLFLSSLAASFSQEVDTIANFLQNGKDCHRKGDFFGAADEFENVLLLDPSNLEAKIWLAKTYGDLKLPRKAQDILAKAKAQAPDNPEVLALMKLFGESKLSPIQKLVDPVIFETMALLGSSTSLRPLGIIIPESKVKSQAPLTIQDSFDEATIEVIGPATEAEVLSEQTQGPLSEVFQEWETRGLPAGLEKYFSLVITDKSLSSLDDRNLLQEGLKSFLSRYQADSNDNEARFFVGMIMYFNGDFVSAAKILEPLRGNTENKPGIKEVLAHLDKIEKERIDQELVLKREAEAQEIAKQEAAKIVAQQAAVASAASNPVGNASSPDSLDFDGYENYKKGNLDIAIQKFILAIGGNPTNPKYFYHLGQAYVDKALAGETSHFDRAIEAFNNVVRLDPSSKLAKDAEIMIKDITAAKNSLKR